MLFALVLLLDPHGYCVAKLQHDMRAVCMLMAYKQCKRLAVDFLIHVQEYISLSVFNRCQQTFSIGNASHDIFSVCFALVIFDFAQPKPFKVSTASRWLGQTLSAYEPMPAAYS